MDNQFFTNQSPDFLKPKKALTILKPLFIILGVIIVVELGLGLKTLLTPVKVSPKKAQVVAVSGGVISLNSAKGIYQVGEAVPVTINLSTGNHLTVGADLVVKYDPTKLEASTSSFIRGRGIYDEFPPVNVDPNSGVIRVSGVATSEKIGFNGSGDFGLLQFKAKTPGETEISLEFAPNKTDDSNMMEIGTGKDILEKVNNVKIKIQ